MCTSEDVSSSSVLGTRGLCPEASGVTGAAVSPVGFVEALDPVRAVDAVDPAIGWPFDAPRRSLAPAADPRGEDLDG